MYDNDVACRLILIPKDSGENVSGCELPVGAFIAPPSSKKQKVLWLQRPTLMPVTIMHKPLMLPLKPRTFDLPSWWKVSLGIQGFESESPSVADGIPRWVVNRARGHWIQDNLIE